MLGPVEQERLYSRECVQVDPSNALAERSKVLGPVEQERLYSRECVQVDPSNALGERSKVLGPVEQERPYVLDESSNIRPEKYALNPPNANNSQVIVDSVA